MHRRQLLALATALGGGLLLPGCAGSPAPGPRTGGVPTLADAAVPPPQPDTQALTSPLDAFASRLNRRLAPEPRNLVWSPWSVAMVLAMVRDGAAGDTAAQLTDVLGAGADFDARLADGWRRMAHAQGEPLRAANAVWAQRGYPWHQPFLDRLAALSASLKDTDYAGGNPAAVADEINGWVSGRTAGKITKLVDPSWLTGDTRMVLVNALHFKAGWQRAFDEVGPRPFTAPSGVVQVPFLAGPTALPGRRADGWTSALIDCAGFDFALVVALPDDPAAAPASAPMTALTGPIDGVRVQLTMPAWKQKFRSRLNDALIAEGAPLPFDAGRADFSGMTDVERLFLSFIVHEAVIEVHAKGIEAAAATAAGIAAAGAPAQPIALVLDRPFAYALVHRETGTPLFLGQVSDPSRPG